MGLLCLYGLKDIGVFSNTREHFCHPILCALLCGSSGYDTLMAMIEWRFQAEKMLSSRSFVLSGQTVCPKSGFAGRPRLLASMERMIITYVL